MDFQEKVIQSIEDYDFVKEARFSKFGEKLHIEMFNGFDITIEAAYFKSIEIGDKYFSPISGIGD